jgi:glycosyltransferase involved in cell wall biosynthesis
MKHKVFIIVTRDNNTSIVRLCHSLSSALEASVYDVSLLELKNVFSLDFRSFLSLINHLVHSDFVISCGSTPDVFTFFLSIISPFSRVRYISYLHCDIWSDLKCERNILNSLLLYAIWTISLLSKQCIVCVSHAVVNSLPFFLRRNTEVIYNFTQPLPLKYTFTADINLSKAVKWINAIKIQGFSVIVSYGLFRYRKNLEMLIKFIAKYPGYALVLVGTGPLESSYYQLSQQLCVSNVLAIFPFLSHPSYLCLFADMYISPSHSEGFGLANVEAALTSIPVFVPDLPVNIEILSGFPNVSFFDISSLSSLHAAISKSFSSSSAKPLHIANTRYNSTVFKTSWNSLLSNMLDKSDT